MNYTRNKQTAPPQKKTRQFMVNVCVVYIYIYSWVIVTVSLFLCVVCESSSWFFMVGMWLLQDFWRFTPGGANQLALYAGLEVGGLSCRVNSQEKQQKFWWNRVIVRKWSGIEENPIWQGIFFCEEIWSNHDKWGNDQVILWGNDPIWRAYFSEVGCFTKMGWNYQLPSLELTGT